MPDQPIERAVINSMRSRQHPRIEDGNSLLANLIHSYSQYIIIIQSTKGTPLSYQMAGQSINNHNRSRTGTIDYHTKQPQLLLNEPLRIRVIDNILNNMLRTRPEREHIDMRKTAYANFFIQLLGLREIWMLLPSILRITNLTFARTFEAFIKRWIDAHQ